MSQVLKGIAFSRRSLIMTGLYWSKVRISSQDLIGVVSGVNCHRVERIRIQTLCLQVHFFCRTQCAAPPRGSSPPRNLGGRLSAASLNRARGPGTGLHVHGRGLRALLWIFLLPSYDPRPPRSQPCHRAVPSELSRFPSVTAVTGHQPTPCKRVLREQLCTSCWQRGRGCAAAAPERRLEGRRVHRP